MVFEITGLKLNKKKKNWRNGLFAISPMLVVQFSPNFRYTYILISAFILWCQRIDFSFHPVVSKVDYN